ncbi:MAG TPA: hypothetical protein VMF55_00415 [Solirubrobacterales bacterium]|nr:hypothetical protein [Solirubrobacterales bacterium]
MTVVLALLAPATTTAAAPEYFPLPEGRGLGGGMTVDGAGDVWFGANGPTFADVPPLGRLVPALVADGKSDGIAYYPTPAVAEEPCCARMIRDVAFDPTDGGRVWFTRSTGAVGFGVPAQMSPGTSGGMQVATTPGFPDLGDIAIDSKGIAWYAESSAYNLSPYPGNRIAWIDRGLSIHEFPDLWHQVGSTDSSRYDAKPTGMTIGEGDVPWFTESTAGLPGYRIARAWGGDEYHEYMVTPCEPSPPCSGSNVGQGPLSIAAAPDGTIWFTNLLKNSFGKLDLETSTITQYSLAALDPSLSGGEPRVIRAAPDGTLWLAERGFILHPAANALVRIVPTDPPTATVYPLGAGKAPISLAPAADGSVWFGVSDVTSSIGRLGGVVGAPTDGGGSGAGGATGGGSTGGGPTGGGSTPGPAPAPGALVVKPGSIGVARVGTPTVSGESLTVNQICIGPPAEPCAVVYLLDAGEYVTGFPGTKPRLATASGARKTKRVVVATKTVTIAGGSTKRVVITLNAKGRRILKRDGVLHATLHASQKRAKGKPKQLKSIKVTFKSTKR